MASDALPLLDEPKAGQLTIQYSPIEDTDIVENPPRFSWIPVIDDDARYVLRISSDADYPAKNTKIFEEVMWLNTAIIID